jgi:hypothetical protein
MSDELEGFQVKLTWPNARTVPEFAEENNEKPQDGTVPVGIRASDDWMISELEKLWKGAIELQFGVLSRYMPGGTKKYMKNVLG